MKRQELLSANASFKPGHKNKTRAVVWLYYWCYSQLKWCNVMLNDRRRQVWICFSSSSSPLTALWTPAKPNSYCSRSLIHFAGSHWLQALNQWVKSPGVNNSPLQGFSLSLNQAICNSKHMLVQSSKSAPVVFQSAVLACDKMFKLYLEVREGLLAEGFQCRFTNWRNEENRKRQGKWHFLSTLQCDSGGFLIDEFQHRITPTSFCGFGFGG